MDFTYKKNTFKKLKASYFRIALNKKYIDQQSHFEFLLVMFKILW